MAVIEGKVAWTGDYVNDPSFLHAESSDGYVREIGIQSVMSAPLLDGGRVFGALTIYTRRGDAWGDRGRPADRGDREPGLDRDPRRRDLIEELDRSSAKLARRAEAQQSLLEIAARITAIREPGPLLQQVVDAAKPPRRRRRLDPRPDRSGRERPPLGVRLGHRQTFHARTSWPS